MSDVIAPAEGLRTPWDELPASVRSAVQQILGWRVASARTQSGGFSPGVAAQLQSRDGRRAFVKAVGPHPNPDTPDLHRREARIAAALPDSAPVSRLVGVYDDGHWVALIFSDVPGHLPALPWQPDTVATVLDGIARLHAALTPSPIDDIPDIVDELRPIMDGWRRISDDAALRERVDDWCARHLAELVGLGDGWQDVVRGDTLLHGDLRADNILLTDDGPVFVDWPWAARGAPWVDIALMAPSVAAQGGPAPAAFLAAAPAAADVPDEALAPFVAGLAGYFTHAALLPAPNGLPTLRGFQRMQARAGCDWARAVTGLD